jgi:hypothetical protein
MSRKPLVTRGALALLSSSLLAGCGPGAGSGSTGIAATAAESAMRLPKVESSVVDDALIVSNCRWEGPLFHCHLKSRSGYALEHLTAIVQDDDGVQVDMRSIERVGAITPVNVSFGTLGGGRGTHVYLTGY